LKKESWDGGFDGVGGGGLEGMSDRRQ